jgi:hypothetical protein
MLDDLEIFNLLDDGIDPILKNNLQALEFCNEQLAKIIPIKQALENAIIKELKHDHSGSRTYLVGKHKVIVKTPEIISLNKKSYKESGLKFPFIKESVSYSITKERLTEYESSVSAKERLLVSDFITIKPGKRTVTLEPNLKV